MCFQKVETKKGFPPFFSLVGILIQNFCFKASLLFALFMAKQPRQRQEMFFNENLIANPDPAFLFFLRRFGR